MFGTQSIANSSWAIAVLQRSDKPLWEALSAAARPKLSAFSSSELASTAWANSSLLGSVNGPLLEALASAAIPSLSAMHFAPQSRVNISWAFATMSLNHAPLSEALSAQALPTISADGYAASHFAMLSWSMAV